MKPRFFPLALSVALLLGSCTTTRTLTVSSSNPIAPTDEHGVACLRSGGTNPVSLWLLTPRFRTDPDDLAPPAFRLLAKNGTGQPFAFSPANITASADGTAVHVYTLAEYAGAINAQAVALHRTADQNVAKAKEKLDQLEAYAAVETPAVDYMGKVDFSSVRPPSTEGARAELATNAKDRQEEIETWRQDLLDGARMMLGEHTVPPGEMAGGVIRLDPRAVAAGRTLRLVVTAGGEAHEFVFDVGR